MGESPTATRRPGAAFVVEIFVMLRLKGLSEAFGAVTRRLSHIALGLLALMTAALAHPALAQTALAPTAIYEIDTSSSPGSLTRLGAGDTVNTFKVASVNVSAAMVFTIPAGKTFSGAVLSLGVVSVSGTSSGPITTWDGSTSSLTDVMSAAADFRSGKTYGQASRASGFFTITLSPDALAEINAVSLSGGGAFALGITADEGSAYGLDSRDFTLALTAPPKPPVVTAIAPLTAGSTADSVTFRASFDEPVANVTAGDFGLTTTGGATGEILSVSTSGSTVEVVVGNVQGEGTLRVDLLAQNAIRDLDGNGGGVNGTTQAFATGQTHAVDRVAPAAPEITDPLSGSKTNSNHPLIVGKTEPDLLVDIVINGGGGSGQARADGAGVFTYRPATPLADGSYTITAKAGDAAGNVSGASRPVVMIIDTTPPAAPIVTSPQNGFTLSGSVVFQGTAEAKSVIQILLDETTLSPVIAVDADGAWRYAWPTALSAGSHTYGLRGMDEAGNTSALTSGAFTYTPLAVPGGALATAQVGTRYSQTVTASGGVAPYSYTIVGGGLPTGLTLSADGVLSGTPTSGGSFSFTILATDSNTPGLTSTGDYTLAVSAAAITVTPASLPGGTRGAAYSQTLSATGGTAPYTYSVTSGDLPAGLSLTAEGVLRGTPTGTGTFNFTVTARDSSTGGGPYTGVQAYSVSISAAALTITPGALTSVVEGMSYSQQLSTAGGYGTYSYAVTSGALPADVTLSTSGLISGRPTASGVYSFTIRSTDAFGNTGMAAFSLTVTARPNPALDPEVRGLASAQASAVRRFADTQISNFQSRLEQLHSGSAASSMNLSLDASALMGRGGDQANRAKGAMPLGQTLMGARERSIRSEAEALMNALRAADSQTTDSMPVSGPAGSRPEAGGVRVWTSGAISLGERDATSQTAKLSIHTSGISVGADMSASDTLDIGLGVGFGQEDTDVGTTGSNVSAESWVGVIYASWRPTDGVFVDGLTGYGALDYDLTRRVTADQSLVFGQREGGMWFGSVTGGIDRMSGPARWIGYGRLDLMTASLDGYTETGSPSWSLAFEDRTVESRQAALGVRYERRTVSGTTVWTPGLRLEWSHEFGDAGSQTIRYADFLTGPAYNLDENGWDRSRALIGATLRMYSQSGWKVDGDLSARLGAKETVSSVRLTIAKPF